MPKALDSLAAAQAQQTSALPQRLAKIFDTINLSARLYDEYLSDEAVSKRAARLRQKTSLQGGDDAFEASPKTMGRKPAPNVASPLNLSSNTSQPMPSPQAQKMALGYFDKQLHLFYSGACFGRSVQQVVIHPLFYWPLLGLTRLLPDKLGPSLGALRARIFFPATLARAAIASSSIPTLAPVGWAILLARVFECYVGRGNRLAPRAESAEDGPTFFGLDNFERFGLIGLVTEMPLLRLCEQAKRKNRHFLAEVLIGAACVTTLALQGVRLGVVGLIGINMAMCGAVAVLFGSLLDIASLALTAINFSLAHLSTRSEKTHDLVNQGRAFIHHGNKTHEKDEKLKAECAYDEAFPNDIRATAEQFCAPTLNPHATSLSTANLLCEEQKNRAKSQSSHMPLNIRGPSPAQQAEGGLPETPTFAKRPPLSRIQTPANRSPEGSRLFERQQSLSSMTEVNQAMLRKDRSLRSKPSTKNLRGESLSSRLPQPFTQWESINTPQNSPVQAKRQKPRRGAPANIFVHLDDLAFRQRAFAPSSEPPESDAHSSYSSVVGLGESALLNDVTPHTPLAESKMGDASSYFEFGSEAPDVEQTRNDGARLRTASSLRMPLLTKDHRSASVYSLT